MCVLTKYCTLPLQAHEGPIITLTALVHPHCLFTLKLLGKIAQDFVCCLLSVFEAVVTIMKFKFLRPRCAFSNVSKQTYTQLLSTVED